MSPRLIILAIGLLALCGCSAPQDVPSSVTIATWNLQWFPGRSSSEASLDVANSHIEEVAAVLREIDADIIFAQEIKDPTAFKRMAEKLGYQTQIVSSFAGLRRLVLLPGCSSRNQVSRSSPKLRPRRQEGWFTCILKSETC